jgi:sulfhydrogenase subunit beta (sulfur reductase)
MTSTALKAGDQVILEHDQLQKLLEAIVSRGYSLKGPTIRENAIIYDDIASVSDLPAGWTDEQDGGTYRLKRSESKAVFAFTCGPHSWKQFLHPPTLTLWQAERDGDSFDIVRDTAEPPRFAFIGVRSCELQAIALQDNIFLHGKYVDPTYRQRRENVLIVAVNCTKAGGTCFCASMGTGPKAGSGFDVALTETIEDGKHYFVAEAGSVRGAAVLTAAPHRKATKPEVESANQAVECAAGQMGRTMDTTRIKELLYGNYEHPRFDQTATRCLSCANCTMACPTCFCHTVEDVTDLTGDHALRCRKWDSCFTLDFSYIHGGSVRTSVSSRYRQWLTHKLATWIDQFGSSGCVGCGRCITWCPVGIDITEEVSAIRQSDRARKEGHNGES